jgi:hypothetical protein
MISKSPKPKLTALSRQRWRPETDDFWGNWFADRHAKAAAEDARFPADAREAHQAALWKAKAFLKARGTILAKWLPPGSKGKDPRTSAEQPAQPRPLARHDRQGSADSQQCSMSQTQALLG